MKCFQVEFEKRRHSPLDLFSFAQLGLAIWSSVSSLSSALGQIEDRLAFLHTVAPLYNRQHAFVRHVELDSRLAELQGLKANLLAISELLQGLFREVYSLDIIDEWFELYLTPVLVRINSTLIDFAPARNQSSWARRPLI